MKITLEWCWHWTKLKSLLSTSTAPPSISTEPKSLTSKAGTTVSVIWWDRTSSHFATTAPVSKRKELCFSLLTHYLLRPSRGRARCDGFRKSFLPTSLTFLSFISSWDAQFSIDIVYLYWCWLLHPILIISLCWWAFSVFALNKNIGKSFRLQKRITLLLLFHLHPSFL